MQTHEYPCRRRISSLRIIGYHQPTGCYAGKYPPLAQLFVRFPALRTLVVNDTPNIHSRVAPPLDTPLWQALGSLWHLDLRVLHARVLATTLSSLRAIRRLSLALDVKEYKLDWPYRSELRRSATPCGHSCASVRTESCRGY